MRLLVVLFCVLSAVSGLRLDAPEHAAKAKPAADAPAPKAAPVADRATALGIAPDVQRDVTAASCETCLKLFFKIAKSPHSSLSFLKNKCPEQHTPEVRRTAPENGPACRCRRRPLDACVAADAHLPARPCTARTDADRLRRFALPLPPATGRRDVPPHRPLAADERRAPGH